MNLVEEISVSRMNERRYCYETAVNYWRKVIIGVNQAENPMMRRARQEAFREVRGALTSEALLQRGSVTMIPSPLLCRFGDALRDSVHQ